MLCMLALPAMAIRAQAQDASPLDPSRALHFQSNPPSASLQEEYIWTAGDVTAKRPDRSKFPWTATDRRVAPHFFRESFSLSTVPQNATLYLAGPRWARVYVNGQALGEFSTNTDQPINFRVFHVEISTALRMGKNVIAVEAKRGRGVVSASTSAATQQLAYGEVLTVKVLPGRFGEDSGKPLLISNRDWRSISEQPAQGWGSPSFDDSGWQRVESLGPIEANIDLRQWSVDAGMYGWPGYRGMSHWLRTLHLEPVRISHEYAGRGSFQNVSSLVEETPAQQFAVGLSAAASTDEESPSLLLDFGREIAGRIVFATDSAVDSVVSVAYGESELEALATGITPEQRGGNYLGTNLVDIPANGVARGPKSAFRYVRVRFLRGGKSVAFRSIHAEAIVYPVSYVGSFVSSDAELNRIWETAAYTAHLCMQDGIWDAPKRDRGRWAGDLDIEAQTILSAFGDTALIEDTLRRLGDETSAGQPVNGITSYTAQWIAALSAVYERWGNRGFVASEHDKLVQLLQTMDAAIDPSTGVVSASARGWGFVDWSAGLYGKTPETQIGTTLEFLRAYQMAPPLLRAANDEENARVYEARAAALAKACRETYLHAENETVGSSWQLNSMAVLTGLYGKDDSAVWRDVFSHVKQDSPTDPVISPYFNSYLIQAMARAGHREEALAWMREYWGGMLAEGATSFWESYDLRWPKNDFHLSLQADGTSGFFVSLAHGWSSGPLSWMAENILGVRPTTPGYGSVEIQPALLGLTFARGTIPTPHGVISVDLDAQKGVTIDLPEGVNSATLYLPNKAGGERSAKILTHAGHYHFAWQ